MINVTTLDFSVDAVLNSLRQESVGGLVVFVGVVRGESEGQPVSLMEVEVYPDMAVKQLEAIRREAIDRFGVEDVHVVHRYGSLKVTENIVLVAVSAGHRGEAFDACRYVIDELKKRVPIWKREHTTGGARWVEGGKPE